MLCPAAPLPLYALADLLAARGEDYAAAGWRWVARTGRRPRRYPAGDQFADDVSPAVWYWTTTHDVTGIWCHAVPWLLLRRLCPLPASPHGYADYPTPEAALCDLARAVALLLVEGLEP